MSKSRLRKSLGELYEEHTGKVSDKWSLYLAEYDRLFGPFREKPIRLLEIGVQNGGSLELWAAFFPNAQAIVGCDINPACAALGYDDPRIRLVVADANTEEGRQQILAQSAGFDLIIDDGSHVSSDIVRSFALYFPHLDEAGLYVAEDLHCSYWEKFTGGLFHPDLSIFFFKKLVDVVNHEHWGIDRSRAEFLSDFEERYQVGFPEGLLRTIHSVEFLNSLCVIEKRAAPLNELGTRIVVGAVAPVAPDLHSFAGLPNHTPDERSNKRTVEGAASELDLRRAEIAALDARIGELQRVADDRETNHVELQRLREEREAYRHEIACGDGLIAGKDQVIAAKDEVNRIQSDRVRGRDALIEHRDQMIRQRDEQLHAHIQMVHERDAELQRQYRVFEDLENENARLVREHANDLVARQRDWLVNDYETRHAAQLADREAAMARFIRVHADELRRVEAVFVNSTSWRITAPARGAIMMLRRFARPGAPAPPPPAAERSAGPLELPAAAVPAEQPPGAAAAQASAEPAQAPSADPAPATEPVDFKGALRRLLMARLKAVLAGNARIELPCSAEPDVTIVLVLHNQAELTLWCLESIVEAMNRSPLAVQVAIVDNASTDLTAELLERVGGADVTRNGFNMHFLRGANAAAKRAAGRYLLLLNNDAQLLPGSLEAAVRTLDEDAGIGAVGGRVILADGTLQEAGSVVWNDGSCSGYGRGCEPDLPDFMFRRDVDYCSGAFLLTPRAVWEELGGFDERYVPAYYEETDYCVRLWKTGLRVVYDPDAAIVHYEFGSSTSSEEAIALQQRNRLEFVAAHGDWLRRRYPNSPANLVAARTAHPDRKRVLVIEDRIPKVALGSGYPRANSLIRELVLAGAEVTLFPMFRHRETWAEVRKAVGPLVEVFILAEADQLRRFLGSRRGHYDCILVCRPHNMLSFREAVGTDRTLIGDAVVLYDAEAVFARRTMLARGAAGEATDADEERRLVAAEVALTQLADAVISVSPAEQQLFETYGVREIHLLAHALAETPVCTPFEARRDIVFLGAIHDDKSPNADSVRWFIDSVLPLLRARLGEPVRLKMIGLNEASSIARHDGGAVELVGQADDLGAALATARVMVVPTRFAAGVPHKVHQAAALGIPMVVTRLIAEQTGWTDGEDFLAAADADAFAAACAVLYQDKKKWEQVRNNALQRCREECSPDRFRRRLREILDTVPLVHGAPEAAVGDADRRALDLEMRLPHVGRPVESDFSVAVPFDYYPRLGTPPERIAAVVHLYHVDVATELRYYLANLGDGSDLFISTDTDEKRSVIAGVVGLWDKGALEIRVLPNRGRDIAPKLIGFRDVYDRYEYVLHLHSKKSRHATFLAPWRSFLYENLIGSRFVIASVFEAFAHLPDLGLVFPQHFEPVRRWLDWTGNLDIAKSLAARMGIALQPERALDFPSGSMFWARSAALRPLLDLGLTFDDFPEETGQVDDTPAHAIERLYLYACERAGYRWLKIARPELYVDTSTIVRIDGPEALARFAEVHGEMLSGPNPPVPSPEPAPMMTAVPPGLTRILEARRF